MEKVIYTTKFDKPIFEGQVYAVVLEDGSIITTTASADLPEDPRVVQRFLTKGGAVKFVNNGGLAKLAKKAPTPKVRVKTPEEQNEERLLLLHPFQQLVEVQSEEQWKKWLLRNKLTITASSSSLSLASGRETLIYFGWSVSGVPYCCGGRENGSHNGALSESATKFFNPTIMKTLAKYLAPSFDSAIKSSLDGFGTISYVVKPDNVTHPSARLGYIFAASKYFQKVSTFVNKNTKNLIDIYVTNNTLSGKGEDLLSDDDDE